MRRREFIMLAGSAAAAWPLAARGQPASDRPLIAYLAGGRRALVSGGVNAFREGLRELGHEEGRNIDIVYRFAEGRVELYPVLAEELVGLKPAVILAGAVDTVIAVRKLTATIPIVSPALADAVHLGLVASYARPGGNVTGITPYLDGLPAKQMELAREVVPGATPEVRGQEDIDSAMKALARAGVDIVIVLQSTMAFSERRKIVALAAANRLPTMCGYREHVDDGGLISYGVNLRWCGHRAATFVHKILTGTAPGDLPVEFPTKVEMVVNLTAAKALGLTFPPEILARADEVVE
jgi:putative ABC transport system substrate-binding protein